jgi:hypothetical protein
MRFILLILIPPVILFCLALFFLWIPAPPPIAPPFSSGRNLFVAVTTGVLGLGYLFALALYGVSQIRAAGRSLDPAFTAIGLRAEHYLTVGRQYGGTVDGREMRGDYVPGRVLNPGALNVYLSLSGASPMAIGRRRPLLDCTDCPPVDLAGLDLAGLQVYAQDADAARRALAATETRAVLRRLLAAQHEIGRRELYVQPNRLWLHARLSPQANSAHVAGWLADLQALAPAFEQGE